MRSGTPSRSSEAATPASPADDDEGPGTAVVQDVLGLVASEVGVECRVVETRTLRGPGGLDERRPVLHHQGHVVAGPESGVAEGVRQAVRALVQVAVGRHLAGARHDDRGLVGSQGGLRTQVEGGGRRSGLHSGRIVRERVVPGPGERPHPSRWTARGGCHGHRARRWSRPCREKSARRAATSSAVIGT